MAEFFASGRVADVILGFMAVEAIVLLALRRAMGSVLQIADIAGILLPGAFLLLALRGALVDASWGWIALSLSAAFIAHLADLWRRAKLK